VSIFRRRRKAEADAAMRCREFVEVITWYLEGTLPEEDRVRFDEHLAACPHCTAYLDQMRTVLRLTGRITEEDVPDASRDDLLQVYRSWRSA